MVDLNNGVLEKLNTNRGAVLSGGTPLMSVQPLPQSKLGIIDYLLLPHMESLAFQMFLTG